MEESKNAEIAIDPGEEGARRSRRGYDYQDLVAAGYCLQMLSDHSIVRVACETQEDVVLTRNDADHGEFQEFIQVKSNRLDQMWTVAQFCAGAKGTKLPSSDGKRNLDSSIFEKNALRQRGRSNSRFRIVTRTDIKDFDVLTLPLNERDPADVEILVSAMHTKIRTRTTLAHAEVDYWVQNAIWDVEGNAEAVFNRNLRRLQASIESSNQRLLPVVDLEKLLRKLVDETQSMATGDGRIGDESNSMTVDELQRWLNTRLQEIPRYLGVDDESALLRYERESLARCEGLWVAVGVSPEEAESLASQPHIGARRDCFDGLHFGFHWLVATYGAGKSLAVEREFQRQVSDYAAQRDDRVPIFLRAAHVSGSLQKEVVERLHTLHQESASTKLFLIIDGVDEAGTGNSQWLLQEAYEVSRSWPGSTVIATSTPMQSGLEKSQVTFPRLSHDLAAEIVGYFAGRKVWAHEPWDRLGSDSGLALFCVLLGINLREAADSAPSKAELLHRVVDGASRRSDRDSGGWAEEHEMLCNIAMLSTNLGGVPVAINQLGIAKTQLAPLLKTRLVAEEGGKLSFTVTTMRFWFAMTALDNGLVSPDDIVSDRTRARHWIQPLAMFAAVADFDKSVPILEQLAARNPAIAARIISDSTVKWGAGVTRTDAEFLVFEGQIKRCLNAWLAGIAPLSQITGFTDRGGNLFEIRSGSSGLHTEVNFTRRGERKPCFWMRFAEATGPAEVWRKTLEMTVNDLQKFVESAPLSELDSGLLHEELWNRIAGFVKGARWFGDRVEWDIVDRILKVDRALRPLVASFKESHPDGFPAPHPPADRPETEVNWIPNFYTPATALLQATSIYTMALTAYQEIVQCCFPNFAHELRHSAWWPCRLVGVVVQHQSKSSDKTSWSVDYHCEPVETAEDAGVNFKFGTVDDYLDMISVERIDGLVRKMHPSSAQGYWGAGGD